MKLVIDIPEEDYKRMIEQSMFGKADVWRKAIQNGTPLPKGHGDLIDRKALMENAYTKGFCSWYDEIKMADTIIEADTESEDKA
jgi:hypothetical protein